LVVDQAHPGDEQAGVWVLFEDGQSFFEAIWVQSVLHGEPFTKELGIPGDLDGVAGPILLVDDVTDTGWTFTMAARVLRRAGADAVLPFALASVN
jgi:hypoxanthine-guanine phosphoribosyltransferase